MKGSNRKARVAILPLMIVTILVALPVTLFAQQAPGTDAQGRPMLEIQHYQWIHNDIIRNIEEIKRARDPRERRDLVEDIEQIIYEKIEFPLSYRQAEISDSFDLNRIGTTSDVTEGKESSPVAPEIAQAYALLGIAKGYEGFGVAAADLFTKAKNLYANVMNMSVSLDHNQDNRTLSAWISASRGYWGNSTATRCTFYGKRISQETVDKLNADNLNITQVGKTADYTAFVAKRDFIRGLKRYIRTDDTLKERKPNQFTVYLPPGRYLLSTEVSSLIGVDFKVSRNVNENNYVLETISDGIQVYPIPDIRVFEEEMTKAARQQFDATLPPEESDMGLDNSLLEEELPALPEPPLE